SPSCAAEPCTGGYFCATDNYCYAVSTTSCADDAECVSLGGVCDSGFCTDGGGSCVTDAECDSSLGEICDGGFCVIGSGFESGSVGAGGLTGGEGGSVGVGGFTSGEGGSTSVGVGGFNGCGGCGG